eukprot:ANDGO_03979.mRNA.1 hypothetical protein
MSENYSVIREIEQNSNLRRLQIQEQRLLALQEEFQFLPKKRNVFVSIGSIMVPATRQEAEDRTRAELEKVRKELNGLSNSPSNGSKSKKNITV